MFQKFIKRLPPHISGTREQFHFFHWLWTFRITKIIRMYIIATRLSKKTLTNCVFVYFSNVDRLKPYSNHVQSGVGEIFRYTHNFSCVCCSEIFLRHYKKGNIVMVFDWKRQSGSNGRFSTRQQRRQSPRNNNNRTTLYYCDGCSGAWFTRCFRWEPCSRK